MMVKKSIKLNLLSTVTNYSKEHGVTVYMPNYYSYPEIDESEREFNISNIY